VSPARLLNLQQTDAPATGRRHDLQSTLTVPAQPTKSPWQVTLELSRSQVSANSTVTYAGTVQAASGLPATGQVTVQKRAAAGGVWIDWRTATLDAKSAYAVTVKMTSAPRHWQFRARMPGDEDNSTGVSPTRSLTVSSLPKWCVTLKLSRTKIKVNERVTYSGAVKTASGRAGRGSLTIQKRPASGGPWRGWRTVTLKANGTYSLPVKMTNARVWQVRAKKAGNAANSTGFSATKKLTVTAR
jgi:hypothetical protein